MLIVGGSYGRCCFVVIGFLSADIELPSVILGGSGAGAGRVGSYIDRELSLGGDRRPLIRTIRAIEGSLVGIIYVFFLKDIVNKIH